jgi:hypothetical protein
MPGVRATYMRRAGAFSLAALIWLALACCGDDNGVKPDTKPPTVVSTSPVAGADNVMIGSTITATFSEEMKPSSISSATFTISGGVTGTVSYAGRIAVFTPAADFAYGTDYTATITTGAQDLAGNGLAAPYVWTFTTLPLDAVPTVIATSPQNGDTAVLVNTVITATFSKGMNPATITPATFTVSGNVTGTLAYAGRTATFTPDSNLAFNMTYTVTVTTGVADSLDIPLAQNHVWSFKTGPVRIMDGLTYFPMANGDTWYYTDLSSQKITRVISGDTMVNGVLCKQVVENDETAEAWAVDTAGFYVHLLTDVYHYRFVPPLEIPFDLVINELYNYNSNVYWLDSTAVFSGTLKFNGYTGYDVPAGHFDNVMDILYLTYGYHEYYAKGVGLLDNGDYILDSALIGGVWFRR